MPQFDVVVLSGTPGGLMAAIAAARRGKTVAVLERSTHIGGLPANGLGATDIATRGVTGGLFKAFVNRVKQHYADKYGPDSQQVKDSSDGHHFEPHVGELVLEAMVAEHKSITILRRRQFDAIAANVKMDGKRPTAITVTNLDSRQQETYTGQVFIDASYEGDLAAACGCAFETRREGFNEYKEPLAGRVYRRWGDPAGVTCEGTTGEGDDTLQAYNYRLCLTDVPAIRVTIDKPARYNRDEFASLVDDVLHNRAAGPHRGEKHYDGIGKVVNIVILPNGKTDSNNQHLAFVSTDLPEENYPWPTADWAWRDAFATRLREYTLGLLYFAQNDPALPEEFRKKCAAWGLARDEYQDNSHFPRQVYVREGRRITGDYLFTAHDSLPTAPGGRPPIHGDAITSSHYPIDSHAHHKREPGRCHLDGFLSHRNAPYTVPFGIMLPKGFDNILTPVPVSATHLGFGTLRMEPCWMAMGEAAGTAAALAIEANTTPRAVNIRTLQHALLDAGAVLVYFKNMPADPAKAKAVQLAALAGEVTAWEA